MNNNCHASHEGAESAPTASASHVSDAARVHSHRLMMLACCIPVLLIAVVLVAAHLVSATAIVFALGCTLMMAFMMRGMNHGSGGH